jgi:hypothetical protein
MDEITVNLHKDQWVLSHLATIADSIGYFEIPPVTILDWGDKEGLRSAIENLLAQPMSVVEQDIVFPPEPLGCRAKAVGAKTVGTYVRDTRCFAITRKENHILLEEFTKVRGGWDAHPVWEKRFLSDQLDELINFLMKKTKPESSPRNSRAGNRTRKTSSGRH